VSDAAAFSLIVSRRTFISGPAGYSCFVMKKARLEPSDADVFKGLMVVLWRG
jgi:hypothetical protein